MKIQITIRYELACFTLGCCCRFFGGTSSNVNTNDCTLTNGQKVTKAKRKELRMLTDQERTDIFNAIVEMKKNGEYDYFANIHKSAFDDGRWHCGPSFLLVHRELLKRFEIVLRKINPNIGLPYWDTTLEARLQTPADSILFTDLFLGSTDSEGNVVNGAFSPWKTLEGNKYITRKVGQEGRCINEDDVQWILSQTKLDNILSYTCANDGCPCEVTNKWPEFLHGKTHSFIGGDMGDTSKSANDFTFYAFHNFLNLKCCSTDQYKDSPMYQLEPLKNSDGLRNEYNDNMYEYANRPTCNATNTDCGSKYLFCDLSKKDAHCASKVRLGGDCRGFPPGTDVCWNSTCVNDVCIYQPTTVPVTTVTTHIPTTVSSTITTKMIVETSTLALPTTVKVDSTKVTVPFLIYTKTATSTNEHSTAQKDTSTSKVDSTKVTSPFVFSTNATVAETKSLTKESNIGSIAQEHTLTSTQKTMVPPKPPKHVSNTTNIPLTITLPEAMKKDVPDVISTNSAVKNSASTPKMPNPIDSKSTPTVNINQNTTHCIPKKLSFVEKRKKEVKEFLRRLGCHVTNDEC
uniref:Tyrosinase_Cu-bd domain-containing protein n=1 Tax=Meloidogyne hapla TaxID=6305 RepID=A0A1I8AZD9_MELHA